MSLSPRDSWEGGCKARRLLEEHMGPEHHGKAVGWPSTLRRDAWAPKGSFRRDVGDPGDHGKAVAGLEAPARDKGSHFVLRRQLRI